MRRIALTGLLLALTLAALIASAQSTPPVAPGTATAVICVNAPLPRLIVRERARVAMDDPRPLNVRVGPGTSFERVGQLPPQSVFYVLEGPQCSERYAWYRVESGQITGWVAEGDLSLYYVEVYPPGQ
jgi:hypothetical protein